MAVLTAAVLVLAVLVLLNLALTVTVIRRLRTDAVGRDDRGGPPLLVGLPVGAPVPRFHAEGSDGETLTTDDLEGALTLLAFSTTGTADAEHAPDLVDRSEGLALAGVAVVPVLLGHDDPQQLAPVLGAAGPLVRERHGGPLSTAFDVRGTPSYVLVGPDARVLAAGGALADVVAPVATAR